MRSRAAKAVWKWIIALSKSPASWYVHPMLLAREASQLRAAGSSECRASFSAFPLHSNDSLGSSHTRATICMASIASSSKCALKAISVAAMKWGRASTGRLDDRYTRPRSNLERTLTSMASSDVASNILSASSTLLNRSCASSKRLRSPNVRAICVWMHRFSAELSSAVRIPRKRVSVAATSEKSHVALKLRTILSSNNENVV
ncbi:hypothetical protein H310_10470 [Aphanomyces invadans]|uniref:Uncharacterized protein n=1 Tax=Aphanomyces invadans TaxID=157072 RepID=A0A024TQ92_9STRA|nr:hypothetical protein H310_10470 [Aphanomyces invadans]ETV96305.1 hypothetical protein H310_10470 [Aphanomyces invadans]|eukprot:XP_008875097.1 hypothetical protein H310_10470 [Aphanomyces invadans]